MNGLINDYFKLKNKIYKSFDYVEDWKVHPMDDMTSVYWSLSPDNTEVQWFYKKEDVGIYEKLYSGSIGSDRFLVGYIYVGKNETEGLTMILVDTQTDGNVILMIFDNAKKIDYKDFDE